MSLILAGVVRFWSFNAEDSAPLEAFSFLSFSCYFDLLETNVEPTLKQLHWEDTALAQNELYPHIAYQELVRISVESSLK